MTNETIPRCEGFNRSRGKGRAGQRCANPALSPSPFCEFHQPEPDVIVAFMHQLRGLVAGTAQIDTSVLAAIVIYAIQHDEVWTKVQRGMDALRGIEVEP